MNELAIFSGVGGGILGGKILGWRTICAVERDAYCASILAQRQNDGILEPFPIWSDVQSFEGRAWRGRVDVISCGFPCQDISTSGLGAGITGSKSGLWKHGARIIDEVLPNYVFVENSPALTSRGLGTVLGDLSAMGYNARWGVMGADIAGFPHHRARMWLVAHSKRGEWRKESHNGQGGRMGRIFKSPARETDWESVISKFRGDRYGMANRLDRTDAIRNGQVPGVAARAWEILK